MKRTAIPATLMTTGVTVAAREGGDLQAAKMISSTLAKPTVVAATAPAKLAKHRELLRLESTTRPLVGS